MTEVELLGEVHDGPAPTKRKPIKPTTAIGIFYAKHKNDRITHWCKKCKRWHGENCFYRKEEA